jgi:hypothetical protein
LVLKRELFGFAWFGSGVYEATESSSQAPRGFLALESFYQQDTMADCAWVSDAAAGRRHPGAKSKKKKSICQQY